MEKETISLFEAEQKILGITHQEIGLKLAESWNLDKNILNVIRYHNDGLIGSNYDQLVGVVHISNILAKLLNLGHSGCDRISQPNQLLWRRLDITRFDKNIIYDRIETDYEQAKEILIIN